MEAVVVIGVAAAICSFVGGVALLANAVAKSRRAK